MLTRALRTLFHVGTMKNKGPEVLVCRFDAHRHFATLDALRTYLIRMLRTNEPISFATIAQALPFEASGLSELRDVGDVRLSSSGAFSFPVSVRAHFAIGENEVASLNVERLIDLRIDEAADSVTVTMPKSQSLSITVLPKSRNSKQMLRRITLRRDSVMLQCASDADDDVRTFVIIQIAKGVSAPAGIPRDIRRARGMKAVSNPAMMDRSSMAKHLKLVEPRPPAVVRGRRQRRTPNATTELE